MGIRIGRCQDSDCSSRLYTASVPLLVRSMSSATSSHSSGPIVARDERGTTKLSTHIAITPTRLFLACVFPRANARSVARSLARRVPTDTTCRHESRLRLARVRLPGVKVNRRPSRVRSNAKASLPRRVDSSLYWVVVKSGWACLSVEILCVWIRQ